VPVEGVKLTMEYFIDKRVFVTGRKSVLSLDNPFNLTAFVNSQISLMGVSCAQNGLNIQTALDPITGTQTNCTELGGTLLHGTTVTGGGHQFAFDTVDLDFTGDFWFTQYAETIAIRSAQTLLLRGDSTVKLITPSIVASTGTAGQILTLQSSAGPVTGGTCEWADPSAAMLNNIYTADGTVATNRSIGGDGELYSITFEEFSTFQVSDTNDITLSSLNNLTLSADNAILIKTPGVAGSQVGDILTAVVAGTGECEWQTPSGLLNVGLGLTESPAGTVKLGGAGIGSSENLEVANAGLWEVKESGTVADTNLSLGIGTNPSYGPGIISNISTTGTQATTGIVNPAVGFSFEIIADNYGTIGNSIVITTDGVNTIEQLVINWNLANPSNTATVTYYLGSGWGPLSTGVSHTLSGGSGLIPSTALNAVLASYPPQPIMYQTIPSQDLERFVLFDTSILISNEVGTQRGSVTVSDSQVYLESSDAVGNAMYIQLQETNGVKFGNSKVPVYSYNFPTADGLAGQGLVNDGGNNINWEDSINVVSTAINYTANHKEVVLVTTGATDKDITLPLAARPNQQITIKKIDPGAGVVHVLGNGVETIDGVNDQPLNSQYNAITVISNGTEWFIISNF